MFEREASVPSPVEELARLSASDTRSNTPKSSVLALRAAPRYDHLAQLAKRSPRLG